MWSGSASAPNLLETDNMVSRDLTDNDVLGQKLREEARAIVLERKNRELLDGNELAVCVS